MHYTFPGPSELDTPLAYIVDTIGLVLLGLAVIAAFWWAWRKG